MPLCRRVFEPTLYIKVNFYYIDSRVLVTKQSKTIFIVEVTCIWAFTCKTNKLQNIYTMRRGAEISIQKWEIKYFLIKIIYSIVYFRWNYDISYRQDNVKKGDSVSK